MSCFVQLTKGASLAFAAFVTFETDEYGGQVQTDEDTSQVVGTTDKESFSLLNDTTAKPLFRSNSISAIPG